MGSLLVWITPHSHCSAAYNPHDLLKGMFQVKAAIRNFWGLKMNKNQLLSKYIIHLYFTQICNGKIIIMISNLSCRVGLHFCGKCQFDTI